ncbi:hypothetical protein ES705_26246 [subsurface metagenome]
MTKEDFLNSLKAIIERTERKKKYLNSIVEDVQELIDEFQEEE